MINVNELRLGNCFMNNQGFIQRVSIETLEYLCNDEFAPHDIIDPIPLNPAILSRTNLNLESFNIWQTEDYSFFIATVADGYMLCDDELGKNKIGKPFKFLHQLQNIFFDLQQEELFFNDKMLFQ